MSTILFSQVGRDSLVFSVSGYNDKILINSLDKQLNTYNFNTLAKYFISSQNYFIGVKENFISTIISTATKNIKDEQYLWALGQYSFTEQLKAGIHINNNIFSDDRNIGLNKASLITSSFYLRFNPDSKIQITPFAGYEENNQIGESDKGIIYGAEANIDKYDLGDFEVNSFMKFQNENIQPRKNTLQVISIDMKNNIEDNFSNIITGYYSQQRRDFYFVADQLTASEFQIDNNIQSRIETNYFVQDRIKLLPVSSPFSFDVQGRVGWRGIDRSTKYISLSNAANSNYDTKIEEFKLEFGSVLQYSTQSMDLSLRFSFSEKDEKYQPVKYEGLSEIIFNERNRMEEQKNNTAILGNLAFTGRFEITNNDRITLDFFQRKLKYDTPSKENFDDRDELLSIGRILYEHQYNSFLRIFVNLEGSLNKIVYLYAERSANNNIKRTLKLSSGGAFSSGNLTSTNSAEVSANYTVFKYEDLNPNYRSYSFRQFAFRDSSQYKINSSINFLLNGYIKLSEQGDFKWSEFTSKPLRYLQEIYTDPKFTYNYLGFVLGIGARYFSLSTYDYKNGLNKNKVSLYESIGPLAEITYLVADRISIRLMSWYEFIVTEDNTHREMGNLNFKLSYNL